MTLEEAKRILHPDTTREAIKDLVLDGVNAVKAAEEACLVACEAIDKVIAGQWVPVSERLPEADFDEYFHIQREYPEYIVKIKEGQRATLLNYNGAFWRDDCGNHFNVTHWMPLPEPPEEEK